MRAPSLLMSLLVCAAALAPGAGAQAPARSPLPGQTQAQPQAQARTGPAAVATNTASANFWRAVEANDVAATRSELARGASPNAVHPEKGPAIVVAAREKAFDVVRLLASLDSTDLEATNSADETALMLVCLHGDQRTVETLIQRGAQVNRPGWTPLHYAATNGHVEIARLLLEQHHAFIDAQSPNYTTPLMMAARMKHLYMIALLMEQGADPTLRNQAGLDATAYLERNGDAQSAAWMRERALRYIARYGTIEQPRWTDTPDPAQAADSGGGLGGSVSMKRDTTQANEPIPGGGAPRAPSAAGAALLAAPPGSVTPGSASSGPSPSAPSGAAAPRPSGPAAGAGAKPATQTSNSPTAPRPVSPPRPPAAAPSAASIKPPPPIAPIPPANTQASPAPAPPAAASVRAPEPTDSAPVTFSRTLSIPDDAPSARPGVSTSPASGPAR